MEMHEPVMDLSHSPFVVTHDVACAVCGAEKAVYNTNEAIFQPCWGCQSNGWQLKLTRKRRWKRK